MNKDEAHKLLPWFAVGALDADETLAVAAHLEDSPELRRELAELQVLEQEVVRMSADEPEFRPALMDDALRRIDAYEETREAARPATRESVEPGMIASAVEWLRETLVTGWIGSPAGARLAMAAQFALILVLGGILLMPPETDSGDPAFSTLAGSNAAQMDGGATIDIVFQPTVTETLMREMLADVGGEIVAGPSQQGNYSIRLDSTDEAEVQRALERLRGQTDIVRFAAPVE